MGKFFSFFQFIVNRLPFADRFRPVPEDDTAQVTESDRIVIDPLSNDRDPQNNKLEITKIDGKPVRKGDSVDLNGGGKVMLNEDGTLTFDPDDSYEGLDEGETAPDMFTYTISDGLFTSTATFDLTIVGEDDAPEAVDDTARTLASKTAALDVLSNDSDPEGKPLRITAINGEAFGPDGKVVLENGAVVSLDADGGLIFESNGVFDPLEAGDTETLSFQYTISDGTLSSVATQFLTIVGEDDAPKAVDDTGRTRASEVARLDVLANDSDPEGRPLKIIAINGEEFGPDGEVVLESGASVSLDADGALIFDANGVFDPLDAGQTPPLSFQYTISDGTQTSVATQTLMIIGEDDAPRAVDDTGRTRASEIARLDVLANDSDPEGQPLKIIAIDGEAFGPDGEVVLESGASVSLDPDGALIFDANGVFDPLDAGQTPPLSFQYTISDGTQTNVATQTLTIIGEDDAPRAADDTAETRASEVARIDVLGNDSDPEGKPLRITAINGEDFGPDGKVVLEDGSSVSLDPDGALIFNANGVFDPLDAGETDTIDIVYTISDGNGSSDANLSLTIIGEDDAPRAVDDTFETRASDVATLDVLANDSDPEGRPLRFTAINGEEFGPDGEVFLEMGVSVSLDPDGALIFNANGAFDSLEAGETFPYIFEYTITDGALTSAAEVTVNVLGDDEPGRLTLLDTPDI
ncbi:MAG: Ig-like domain-containing protein [Pseudomonadota bacterium]